MFDTDTPFDLLDPAPAEPDPVPDPLVADLDWLPPGIMLAAGLDRLDRDRLSGPERVTVLKARARQIARDQAELLADIHAISQSVTEEFVDLDPHGPEVFDIAASEISAALSLTRRASEVHLELADNLYLRLPQVWQALHEGLIDLPRARVLSDQTVHLPEQLAREVCDTILERAQSQTTGQLRARIQKLIISIDPASAKERYEQKLTERKVVCEPTEAGTANLCGYDLPADDANRAMRRINRKAKRLKAKGDRRPIDQIRADLFLDMLNGRDKRNKNSGNDQGVMDMRAELTTIMGLDDHPGEIPGWGPVIADVARQVVGESQNAEWRYGITHQNQLIAAVTSKRRPTAAQKRFVELRDPECVFPTCPIGSPDCDIDHQIPWAKTHHTTISELDPLCPHHNQVKEHGWKLQEDENGTYIWTSPLGHTYIKEPDPP